MDLFDQNPAKKRAAPLAERMRPQALDDIIGQEHLLGKGKVLRTLIEKDALHSIIFWGPPGVGKTTIASVIANTTGAEFIALSAVSAGIKEAREIIKKASDTLKFHSRRTILFIDEIHRFNKAQQDAFLPSVEDGTIILIGATTENPSFEVNSALLSRSQVFVLKELGVDQLKQILMRAIQSPQGLDSSVTVEAEAEKALLEYANGDARSLLNILEISAVLSGSGVLTKVIVDEAVQQKALRYDKDGEEHYTIISAFIKSMRNSDPNAALYWLARMIDGGEDPLFIARRMVVFASEDVGLADPQGLMVAVSVFEAVDRVGMPEGRIPLAHGATYLTRAPKDNTAYLGIEQALSDVKELGNLPVPLQLRNATTKLMKELGYHKGYKYAHDFDEKTTDMECMPEELRGKKYLPE